MYPLPMNKEIVPSHRATQVSEYWFSRKLKEIAALNAQGFDIISLGIGGPDLPPPASAVEAAVACLERPDSHSYQMTTGMPQLRKAFARWYKRHYGVELDADREILPLIGSKEGVLNVAMAFVNEGDGVLVPNPGYPTYTSASRLAGGEIFYYDLDPQRGGMPDFEVLKELPLDKIKLMWVNYPHMPTGTPASLEVYKRLVQFGRENGILIVNDNPYSFIRNNNPLSILNIPGAMDVALEMNSLSKCLNMAGWRVGLLAGRSEFLQYVLRVKSNIDSGQPRAIMEGAIAALDSERDWYDTLNAEYYRREVVAGRIMDALGCTYAKGQQGLFLWGRIPDSAVCGEAFADEVLDSARVFITPGFIFGSRGDRYIRISLCAKVEMLEAALQRILSSKSNI